PLTVTSVVPLIFSGLPIGSSAPNNAFAVDSESMLLWGSFNPSHVPYTISHVNISGAPSPIYIPRFVIFLSSEDNTPSHPPFPEIGTTCLKFDPYVVLSSLMSGNWRYSWPM